MGANKTKINKTVLRDLVMRTNRTSEEIKAMNAIFRRHFPNGKIESPQDLWRCLQKFSLVPIGYNDPTAVERLYRLFDVQNRDQRTDGSIDFFHFMIVSHILERGTAHQKISLYFESLDVNRDRIITREDLQECLPPTVESQQLIQQLLKQWDMNKDGVVSLDDFERFINTNPSLSPMFVSERERLRMNSVSAEQPTDIQQSEHYIPANRNPFVTSK
ncbi:unnamed protein product [Adineta steineri]|uniref:EF-hand domain-containing protein n=1 Tax=Adineta steineri TaxID=433720 RepID=A0A818J4J3_9BILA|nr:unnamed protein product [Adineta steineri]CAF0984042.1 unnamed protein product [Adineta steineri]CAF3533214.1 unnamed protein product [Adineta steineri]CAF3880184.1 unnamed protein product [Adineta steineri]CAF4102680.1 unnamed protein product [Adineta steineri]